MSEVDYVRLLRSEFERQSFEKCLGIALRAAISDFPTVNVRSSGDLSENAVKELGRVLLQSVVYWRFQSHETHAALSQTVHGGLLNEPPESDFPVYLVANAAINRDSGKTLQAVESVLRIFSSAFYRQQFSDPNIVNPTINPTDLENAKERYKHGALTEIENPLSKVYLSDFKAETDKLFDNPLRENRPSSVPEPTERDWYSAFFNDPIFSFWREWRQGFLDGKPMDWELQRRVALIDSSIWKAGPKAVAVEIEKIQARWNVEKALNEVRAGFESTALSRHGMGGNFPPEAITDKEYAQSITLIWDATEDLSKELEKERPEKDRINAILQALQKGLAGAIKWVGRKADLVVDTTIVTTIKWAVPTVGGVYVAANTEKIQALIKALEDWLPLLP